MKQPLFLGIDQSFTSTGITLLDRDGALVHHGVIRSEPSQDIFRRAWSVSKELVALANKYRPTLIGIEGLAFSKFGNATRDLAGLQMVIVTNLRYVHSHTVEIISPNLLKKFATEKGNSDKAAMFAALPEDIKTTFTPLYKKTKGLYDVTDSYWLGRYVYELNQKRTVVPGTVI